MSEAGEIKRDGGKAQKNSGRGKFAKGDYTWHNFLVDVKEYAEGYRIDKKKWAKICQDTFTVSRDRSPALKLVIGEENAKIRLGVIEWHWLEELVKCWEENHA